MVIIFIACFILSRNLKVKNVSKRQLVAESIVTGLEKFVTGMTGEEGKAYVQLVWSSSNYDYMIVNDVRYDNETPGSNSTFTI